MITYDFFRDRKFEEVRAFELLPRHPNILRFIQAWEEKQHLFIQVSHINGFICSTDSKIFFRLNFALAASNNIWMKNQLIVIWDGNYLLTF